LAPRLFAGSIRKSNRGGLCITRQSTPTPEGVRSLRSRLFLGAGYFYVKAHLMVTRAELDEDAGFEEGYDLAAFGVTRRELDSLSEARVRELLAKGKWGHPGEKSHSIVLAWLEAKDVQRKEDSLETSKRALANSKLATRLAAIALILSVVMAAQRVIEWASK
jgi:hypothetical protein